MFKTILLCYDGSREGRAVLTDGADLARRSGAAVHLLAVIRPNAGAVIAAALLGEGAFTETGRAADEILREGIANLASMGLKAKGHVVIGEPVEEIAAAARRIGADLIVLGHRQRGPLARWWQSSVGTSLLDAAPCSILVAIEAGTDEVPA
jgi:nucleotide-binding universal stress UspA family protein